MNKKGQGFRKNRLFSLPGGCILVIVALAFSLLPNLLHEAWADSVTAGRQSSGKNIVIIAPTGKTRLSTLAKTLSASLLAKNSQLHITSLSPETVATATAIKPDIVVAIGSDSILTAEKTYRSSPALFIATDPASYRRHKKGKRHTAILYMTQPYCRQLTFIKQLNPNWQVLSYLYSTLKKVDKKAIGRCARKHRLETYAVQAGDIKYLTESVNDALKHSDLLLALPDKTIYNSNTVKNILLTSYRNRKPLIAFSANFVRAGALAAIYSDIDDLSNTAVAILQRYIKKPGKFKRSAYYPENFKIRINEQVFNALNLDIPDIQEIKQALLASQRKHKPGSAE